MRSKILLNQRSSFFWTLIILLLVAALSLPACQPRLATFTPDPITSTPNPSPIPPSATPEPTSTPSPPYLIWIDPNLPASISELITSNPDLQQTSNQDLAQISISPSGSQVVGYWTYLLITPFYDHLEGISFSDLFALWSKGTDSSIPISRIYVSQEFIPHLTDHLGKPDSKSVSILPSGDILTEIWHNPGSAALVPISQLSHHAKVISIDQIHPFDIESIPSEYPLTFPVYADSSYTTLLDRMPFLTNFNPDQLTSIALTGVTAMVRDTAVLMEENGILYPGEDVKDILASADITHINNEVAFKPDCPPPSRVTGSLSFCSDDRYLDLILDVGADIIELSGDHFGDKGSDAVYHTLELYQQNDLLTYGGGENLQAGLQPLLLNHNGNKIAIIGCNAKAQGLYATATDVSPGAAMCDFRWMTVEITRLVEDGYQVIATMQHEEVDSFYPIALQSFDFGNLANAGASIVSGSQSHHPQGFVLGDDHFIHYGLGNLFFDQWFFSVINPDVHKNKDKSFIDIHYFYDNRYINSELIPLQFIDNARPRPMNSEEEIDFMDTVFYASKWNDNWIYLYPTGFYETTVTP